MIQSLSGVYIIVFIIPVYLFILIITAFRLNVFGKIADSRAAATAGNILLRNNFLNTVTGKINNFYSKLLKPRIQFINKNILVPAVNLMLSALSYISGRIISWEFSFVSDFRDGVSDVVYFISRLLRKALALETPSLWSIVLILFVVIYFILTI